MVISFEIPETIYNDAKSQLSLYSKTVEQKLIETLQNLALEKREKLIENKILEIRLASIDKSDFMI